MRRHAHHSAVAIADEHVVADPHLDLLARQWMRHKKAGALTLFFLRGHFSFSRTARLALFNKGG